MKKLLTFMLALLVLPCALILTACGGDPPHTHNWSTEYSSDYNNHWLTCDGCNEVKDKNTHDGDICSVCGFDKSHTCSYGSDYLSDDAGHWQQCSICGEPTTKENHSGNICSVCGYNSLEVVTSIRDLEIITYQTDGNGVFTLVKLPDGKNMLIDAGGTQAVDIRTFRRFATDNGFTTIDYMVLTNTFANRTGGAEPILANNVKNFYIPDTTGATYDISDGFRNAVSYANTISTCNVIKLNPTNENSYDVTRAFSYNQQEYSYTIDFMTPVAPTNCETEFDASIFVVITYQNKVVLLTGDATNKNIDNYANADYNYNVDVLITGYHSNYGKDAIRLSESRSGFFSDISLASGDNVITTNYGDVTGLLTLRQVFASYGASEYSSTAFTYATVKINGSGAITVTTQE